MTGVGDLELQSYSRLSAISAVALPAILQNAAAPLTAAFQTALLGRFASTSALAAFAAVSISCGFASRLFNFLVDGVSAKVGKSVGRASQGLANWSEVAFRAQLALYWAAIAGVMAALLLAALKGPMAKQLLELSGEVLREANSYWWLRCGLTPILLLNMANSGILQGFHQLRASAALNAAQSLLEAAGSAAVLAYDVRILRSSSLLLNMGLVSLATQILALAGGLTCVLLLPPREASFEGRQFRLADAWFPGALPGRRWMPKAGARRRQGLIIERSGSLGEPLMGTGPCDSTHSLDMRPGGKKGCSPGHETGAGAIPIADGQHERAQACSCPSAATAPAAAAVMAAAEAVAVGGDSGPLEGALVEEAAAAADTARAASVELGDGVGSKSEEEAGAEELQLQLAHEQERREHSLDFIRDGLNMLIRSMVMNLTFFASLVAASHLGTASLAAFSIISQLWTLISYAVDGFAAAGIVLGSRLASHSHNPDTAQLAKHHLQRLIRRVLAAGLLSGAVASLAFACLKGRLIGLFTSDPAVAAVLSGPSWLVLVLMQPVNGMVFVYDGLMYASQSFTYIRNMMVLGFALAFCPIVAAEMAWIHKLWGVWVASAAYNAWRLAGAAWLIHGSFMREFGTGAAERGAV